MLKHDVKLAVNLQTKEVRFGFGPHAKFLDKDYDKWIRAIIFPSRKRVYFRFYKPTGDYFFVTDDERCYSIDKCADAWVTLINQGFISSTWAPLYAETDRTVSDEDIKC